MDKRLEEEQEAKRLKEEKLSVFSTYETAI